jgi:hypothetical protein
MRGKKESPLRMERPPFLWRLQYYIQCHPRLSYTTFIWLFQPDPAWRNGIIDIIRDPDLSLREKIELFILDLMEVIPIFSGLEWWLFYLKFWKSVRKGEIP